MRLGVLACSVAGALQLLFLNAIICSNKRVGNFPKALFRANQHHACPAAHQQAQLPGSALLVAFACAAAMACAGSDRQILFHYTPSKCSTASSSTMLTSWSYPFSVPTTAKLLHETGQAWQFPHKHTFSSTNKLHTDLMIEVLFQIKNSFLSLSGSLQTDVVVCLKATDRNFTHHDCCGRCELDTMASLLVKCPIS